MGAKNICYSKYQRRMEWHEGCIPGADRCIYLYHRNAISRQKKNIYEKRICYADTVNYHATGLLNGHVITRIPYLCILAVLHKKLNCNMKKFFSRLLFAFLIFCIASLENIFAQDPWLIK